MLRQVKKIFELEASTGILLLIATALSLLIANSENFMAYQRFFELDLPINLGFIGLYKDLTLHDWINDSLMAIFFLLVGLELKEEVLAGELSSKSKAMLPAIAACGGIIFPALIFYFCNYDQPQNLQGFAIPTATDIAFAYGAICLFGKKVPKSLKVFLISLAIFDDLAAIIIIAFFYSQNIDLNYLIFSAFIIAALAVLNFINSTKISYYLTFGLILWLMILKSGIHPTIAGVLLAIFIPHNKKLSQNLAQKLVHKIAPTVNFLILPVFAFANSGVRIGKFSIEIFSSPLFLGIVLGLFLGKQLGVMLFSFLAVKMKIVHLPTGPQGRSSWLQFYGIAVLTGIGFTMSFFIGSLAFISDQILFDEVKIGVLCASFLSATYGIIIIYFTFNKKRRFDE
jgi:NhaA family Na+:H+ antiporter